MHILTALILMASSAFAGAIETDVMTDKLRVFDRYARVLTSEQLDRKFASREDGVSETFLAPLTGVIRIPSFAPTNTCEKVHEALAHLKESGAKQFVVDLRDNPGGQPMVAVCVAALFLGRRKIVGYEPVRSAIPHLEDWIDEVEDGTAGEVDWSFGVIDQETDAPMVALINGGTASASEIVVGALKDHDRATLVGRRTFGKGLTQEFKPLKGHPDLWLGYTVEKYVNPSGYSPDGQGIPPMVPSPMEETDLQTALTVFAH